ncbi:hypothetical protein [Actinophytocola sp.]|uniref:hypothetical protein n=1 Tax=Actinophytocola sp. TaxID=1872138 RepID=UPI002ED1DA1C
MMATVVWWDLAASSQTIDTLGTYLREEGIAPWEDVPGLRLKFWISDRATNRWGAVTLWEDSAELAPQLPPQRASELIGYPPTERMRFEVEAAVGGVPASQDPLVPGQCAPRARWGRG